MTKELITHLEGDTFGFTLADTQAKFDELSGGSERCYFDLAKGAIPITFDEHVELNELFGGLMLIEPTTKVLALVINEGSDNSESSLLWLENKLKIVNLLNYTLRNKRDRNTVNYTVEVIVLAEQAELLQQNLSHLARTSDLIHLISVNILLVNDLKNGDASGALERAMPWLLLANKEWRKDENIDKAKPKIASITKHNYRLPDRRSIEFNPDVNIHLIHGHNGSGKSALAETIELSHSGKIKRLRGYKRSQYHQIIANNDSHGEAKNASVIFGFDDESKTINIGTGLKGELTTKLGLDNSNEQDSHSFMLNQELIERLSKSPDDRYVIFVQAFFKQGQGDHHQYEQLNSEIERWLKVLSTRLGCQPVNDISALQKRLSILISKSESVQPEQFCLPVSYEELQALVYVLPDRKEVLEALEGIKSFDEMHEYLSTIDLPLREALKQQRIKENIEIAIMALEQLEGWKVPVRESQKTYPQLFEQWAIETAQIDLLRSRLKLAQVSDVASDQSKDPALAIQLETIQLNNGLSLSAVEFEELSSQLRVLELKNEMTTQELADLEKSPGLFNSATSKQKKPNPRNQIKAISRQQAAALNYVSPWFRNNKEDQPINALGNALFNGVNANVSGETLRQLETKNQNWQRKALLEHLKKLLAAINAWQQVERHWKNLSLTDEEFTAHSWTSLCINAKKKLVTFSKLKDTYAQTFFSHLNDQNKRLQKALNELIRLFTPARWLYKPLEVVVAEGKTPQDNKLILLIEGSSCDASLQWNTAELNLVCVALFLLCTNYESHKRPTNVLVMDDPLQNMDELTTTYFARGLAKLVHHWEVNNHNQQLIMLFHGEQAIAQFSEELPAAVYKLSWRDAQAKNGAKHESITDNNELSSFERKKNTTFNGKLKFNGV